MLISSSSWPLLPPRDTAHHALSAHRSPLPARTLPRLLKSSHPLTDSAQLPLKTPQGGVHLVQRKRKGVELGSAAALDSSLLGLLGCSRGCCGRSRSCLMRGLWRRWMCQWKTRETVEFSRELVHLGKNTLVDELNSLLGNPHLVLESY